MSKVENYTILNEIEAYIHNLNLLYSAYRISRL